MDVPDPEIAQTLLDFASTFPSLVYDARYGHGNGLRLQRWDVRDHLQTDDDV